MSDESPMLRAVWEMRRAAEADRLAEPIETRYLRPVPTYSEGDIILAPDLTGELVPMLIVKMYPPDDDGIRRMELESLDAGER